MLSPNYEFVNVYVLLQVPQSGEMIEEGDNNMLTESSAVISEADFLTEELSFSTLAPVHLTETTEQKTESSVHPASRGSSPEQVREYIDLDHEHSDSQDMSFYEENSKTNCLSTVLKSEPCFTSCSHGQSNVPFEECDSLTTFEDMSSVIFRDQMDEIQRACQALGILPGMFERAYHRSRKRRIQNFLLLLRKNTKSCRYSLEMPASTSKTHFRGLVKEEYLIILGWSS